MTPQRLALTLTLATYMALAWRARRAYSTWTWQMWVENGVAGAAIFTLWRLVVTAVLGTLISDWNGSRLAPTFSLLYGYRLYYPATEGPILNNVYGPVAALAFLPVTVFRTPTRAILAGGVLQDAFVFGSLLFLVWRTRLRAGADALLAFTCALGACLLLARYNGSAYWFSMIHADGPCLALGSLATALLVTRGEEKPPQRALLASATAVILAAWAKQTAAPLPVALAVGLWLAHGRTVALRYVAMLAAIGAILSGIFLLWLGRPMLFNMVELVSRHGWYRPGIAGLAIAVWGLLVTVRDVIGVVFVLLLVAMGLTGNPAAPLRSRAWIAPLLAAIVLLPTGALGANKVGGEMSSFHSVYYLIAALAALVLDVAARVRWQRALAPAFCLLAIVAAWRSGHCTPKPSNVTVWENNQQVAYEFALRHPGEAYFPWAPLASLLAEGKLYHFEYGMMDRYIGGFDPTMEHFRAYLPPRMHWVAARARIWTFNHFLSDYSVETTLPELPGWIVRTRPAS